MLSTLGDERSKMEEAVGVSVYCPFAVTKKKNIKHFNIFKLQNAATVKLSRTLLSLQIR